MPFYSGRVKQRSSSHKTWLEHLSRAQNKDLCTSWITRCQLTGHSATLIEIPLGGSFALLKFTIQTKHSHPHCSNKILAKTRTMVCKCHTQELLHFYQKQKLLIISKERPSRLRLSAYIKNIYLRVWQWNSIYHLEFYFYFFWLSTSTLPPHPPSTLYKSPLFLLYLHIIYRIPKD